MHSADSSWEPDTTLQHSNCNWWGNFNRPYIIDWHARLTAVPYTPMSLYKDDVSEHLQKPTKTIPKPY